MDEAIIARVPAAIAVAEILGFKNGPLSLIIFPFYLSEDGD
jgi:hypothetical protein